MANIYIYGEGTSKELICFTKAALDSGTKGNRIEIVKDDTDTIFADDDPRINWRLNVGNTDVELVT